MPETDIELIALRATVKELSAARDAEIAKHQQTIYDLTLCEQRLKQERQRSDALKAEGDSLWAERERVRRAVLGEHGDRLTFVEIVVDMADTFERPAGSDPDAWGVTLAEARAFLQEARAALGQEVR